MPLRTTVCSSILVVPVVVVFVAATLGTVFVVAAAAVVIILFERPSAYRLLYLLCQVPTQIYRYIDFVASIIIGGE